MASGVYFDAVLDINMNPLFSGTPKEVADWLREDNGEWRIPDGAQVCVGQTLALMSVDQYIRAYEASHG